MNDPRPPQNRITPVPGAAPANPAGIRPRPAADLHPISMDDDEPSLADNRSAQAPPTGMEPLALVDDHPDEPSAASKIRAFGVADIDRSSTKWKRQPKGDGTGAIRVRSFHGKFSDQALGFMDSQINDWLDANPDIEIKFVTSSVGQFEGKIREPALVLNLWY